MSQNATQAPTPTLRKKTPLQSETTPLPVEVQTASGSVKMPPLLHLDRFGTEFVTTWTRCEPEQVALWIKDGTLGNRAREAQEAVAEEIATLVSQGHSHFEATHDATKKHLQPSNFQD